MAIDAEMMLEVTPVVRDANQVIQTKGMSQLQSLQDLGLSTAAILGTISDALALPVAAAGIGFQLSAAGSIPTTLDKVASIVADAVVHFGADPTGLTDCSDAMDAFHIYALFTGKECRIPAGNFKFNPGRLNYSPAWIDRPFPHIRTAGYKATIFTAASDIDAPMLRINNGTAGTANYNLWRGGSYGGVTFVDPFAASTATGRHGLSIYGFGGTQFGYMKGQGLKGDLLHFERKMFGGNNPDPYNVSFCEFDGIESNASLGYGINNDNSVGVSHCRFKFVRVVDGIGGGIRGLGVASEYVHISMGNQKGWAIDAPFDTLIGGRTTIRLLELDNVEKGYNLESISGLDILESRIVHRFQTAPNVAAVYWPTVCYNISPTALIVSSLNIKALHRTQTGGTLAAIGQFVNCNNSVNLRGCKIDLDISDNGALGVLDTQLVTGLNANSLDVIVTSRGKRVASTASMIGATLRGTSGIQIPTSGFSSNTESAKLIFPTVQSDNGGNYSAVTGYFTAPYTAEYRVSINLTCTMAAGSRIRLGINRVQAPVYLAGQPMYAVTAGAQSYPLIKDIKLNAGDQIYLMADQNTASPVNLSGIIDATVENYWSIDVKQ